MLLISAMVSMQMLQEKPVSAGGGGGAFFASGWFVSGISSFRTIFGRFLAAFTGGFGLASDKKMINNKYAKAGKKK